jgi:succinyl-CoA synthetase alpha subunit
VSILVNKDTKVIVQGVTGREGTFHARAMLDYGTAVVGGIRPGKGGQRAVDDRVPVFNTVAEAVRETGANTTIIFVPASGGAEAILEAADAGIALIVAITEGMPVLDMVKVYRAVQERGSRLIGPNCPGLITPGEAKVGIMPGFIHKPGRVGLVSRSGTLTYEVVNALTEAGLGQSTAVGIGGGPISGRNCLALPQLSRGDDDTDAVVMVGEFGGTDEEVAAE